MNPLGTRARIDELARLLDGAVSGPTPATAGHAALATRIRAIAPTLDVAPRAEFRAALRTRLVAVATVQAATSAQAAPASPRATALEAAVSWSQTRKAQRRMGVLAGSMAGVIAFTGVGMASSRSLPGAPFYGLKRGAEALQLDLARGDVSKGTKHLEFAATRLREVQAMTQGDSMLSIGHAGTSTHLASGTAFGRSLQDKLSDTLADFDQETREGNALLVGAYREQSKDEALRILQQFSTEQHSKLTALLSVLPGAAKVSGQKSLALITSVGANATELLALGTCTGACNPASGGPALPGATPMPGTAPPGCQCPQPTVTPKPGSNPQPTPSDQPSGSPAPPSGEPSTDPRPTRRPASPPPSTIPTPTSDTVPLPTLPPLPLPTLPAPPLPLPTSITDLIPPIGA